MASPEKKPGLPIVTEDDIAAAFGADATSFDAIERWHELSLTNYSLASEIRDRAFTEARLIYDGKETSDQQAGRLMHIATYVIEIFEHAVRRERSEEIRRTTALQFSDGVDDVDLPL